MSGASEKSFDFKETHKPWPKNSYQRALVDTAQQLALDRIADYDEDFTKDTGNIIAAHRPFFDELKEIRTVISIGHSFSPVDWDYFAEVIRQFSDPRNVKRLFGCFGLRDLQNLESMISKLNIDKANVLIFRTDRINTIPIADSVPKAMPTIVKKKKQLCTSTDDRWEISTSSGELSITDNMDGSTCFVLDLGFDLKGAFFCI